MFNLYQINLRNPSDHHDAHILLTSTDEDMARKVALECWGRRGDRVTYCEFVALVDREVGRSY